MRHRRLVSASRRSVAAFLVSMALVQACGLRPPRPQQPVTYLLEASFDRSSRNPVSDDARVVLITPPSAAAGYESSRMVFTRTPSRLEYFAFNRWADAPSRMLAPLLVHALESTGAVRVVRASETTVQADLRLDTTLLHLRQEFSGDQSRMRVSLRAQIVDVATRQVLATRLFEADEPAEPTPYGGVLAANRILTDMLARLAHFCVRTAAMK